MTPPPAPRLKVALISPRDLTDYGLALAEVLASRCELFLIVSVNAPPEEVAALGCARAERISWPRHRDVLGNLRILARLARQVREFDPDVVHVASEGQVWLNLLKPLLGGRPLIVTLHDVTPHPGDSDTTRIPRGLINAFVRSADAVIVHGERLRADAIRVLRLKPEGVHASRHPAISRYRGLAGPARPRSPANALRLLFFGRILPYKGLEVLIEALATVRGATTHLTVAGRGSSPAALASAKARPGSFDLRFRPIPNEETAALFADADVVVLPYLEASQSGVLAIAPSFSLPVIASDVGELGDLVRETGMGLLVPANDPEALALAIARLAVDPKLRQGLAEASTRTLTGALSPDGIWRMTASAYNAALQRRRSPLAAT